MLYVIVVAHSLIVVMFFCCLMGIFALPIKALLQNRLSTIQK